MTIRPFVESDGIALKALHDSHNFDYALPDPLGSDMLAALVLDDGSIHAAALLRLEVNAFLLLDGDWGTPAERWGALKAIHEAMKGRAAGAGIEQANCWLPTEIEKAFAPRIEELGWRKNLWNSYSRTVRQ